MTCEFKDILITFTDIPLLNQKKNFSIEKGLPKAKINNFNEKISLNAKLHFLLYAIRYTDNILTNSDL